MRIAINALPFRGYGGVTYLRSILPVLDRRDDPHRWYVYGQAATLERVRFAARNVVFREVSLRAGMAGRMFSEHLRLPALFREDRIDLVYTANNADLFWAPRPRVIAIRYTEPFVYRHYYNSVRKQIRCLGLKGLTRLSVKTADHVLSVSDYAQRLATDKVDRRAGKCSVIHHGLGEPFTPLAPRPKWASEDYFFASAKMIGYSNLHTLVAAYAACAEQGVDIPLFIAGGPHDRRYERRLKRSVADRGLADKVIFLGYVDQGSMAGGMANARSFVFSSLLEACPNTLIEALGCGAAIVASDTAPNKEVAGESVKWCDGRDATSMANAMLRVAQDETYRNALRGQALQQSRRYTWQRTADQLVALLERVHRRYAETNRRSSPDDLARIRQVSG